MRKLLLLLLTASCLLPTAFAQAPEKFSYQGVARDNSGNVLANQNISLEIRIHSTTQFGTIVYMETQAVTTNSFGLFSVEVGAGNVTLGVFSAINWGGDSYYFDVSLDPSGGNSYVYLGTQQLISVPYALYAKTSGTAGPTGATGAAGSTGAAGPTGANGSDGTSVTIQGSVSTSANLPSSGNSNGDGYITQDSGHLWVWDGNNWVDAGLIQGPAGATGPTGANGATGATGSNGATGATGLAGATGASGVAGATGATGVAGATGATGVAGATGATGAAGATGVAGATGYTGSNGSTGATGATGAAGATGSIGATGATGNAGATGATGATGTGTAGATGATGAPGPTGATGSAGATGVTGSTGSVAASFIVTGNGTDWTIGNISDYVGGDNTDPSLVLMRGFTYVFGVNAPGHPFRISTTNGGAAFSTGVTNNDVQSGMLTFKVPMDAPSSLVYYCTAHSGMTGTITIP